MATIKEIFERKQAVEARIQVFEEVLGLAYDMKGLKESHGEENVDAVLTAIDEKCLTPLREELEQIDKMEVGDGQGKKKPARKKAEAKRPKRASSRKAAGAKAR